MASAAQLLANQANAQLSTGPKTPEGKARSSANSTKDGLTSRNPIVPPELEHQFELYCQALHSETRPDGPLEEEYFHRILTAGWNLRRARSLESTLFNQTNPTEDAQDAARLHSITRYRRELERTFDRALKQLQSLQTQRAILLQQPADIVDTMAHATPVACFSALAAFNDAFNITSRSSYQGTPRFFRSREAALAEAQRLQAKRNEPVAPMPPEIKAKFEAFHAALRQSA